MDGLSIERVEVLLGVSAIVAVIARKARLPYTIGLVVAGGLLGAFGVFSQFALTKDLIYRAFLPPLIFEAAFFIDWDDLKADLAPVLTLAFPGVLISAAVIGTGMGVFAHWPWGAAAVFGALIAATDPVSVVALFKDLKVGGRLRLLVEAESLINDGAAAVLFAVALAAASGLSVSGAESTFTFLKQMVGGPLCGLLFALTTIALGKTTKDHLVKLTLSSVAAYGSFLLAEYLGCSGVLAVLVAGLAWGNFETRESVDSHSNRGNEAVGDFWEFAAFVANSFVFLLIGMRELALGRKLWDEAPMIGLAIAICLAARAITIYGLSGFFARGKLRIPFSYQNVLFWGGLKGALSLALVLGLPPDFPDREHLLAATFGVVGFSVIVQGLTAPLLIRKVKHPVHPT